jgi:hypothetical protein
VGALEEWKEKVAEKILEKTVGFFKLITTWYVVMGWSFLLPYLGNQPIIYCLLLSTISTVFAYKVWDDSDTVPTYRGENYNGLDEDEDSS